MESPVIQRGSPRHWETSFLGVYDSEETAKTMLSDTPINMCISEYINECGIRQGKQVKSRLTLV
jgi:hypothetical protein